MILDLNSIGAFAAVANAGGFSRAAKITGVPVATVSRRVSVLEKSLGVRLLERSTRQVRLTAAGATLFEAASRGIEEITAALLALQDGEQEVRGTLRLSVPPNFEPWWRLIAAFQEAYPKIFVEILVTERKLRFVDDNIDVAVRVGDVIQQTAIGRVVAVYRHVLVASPEYIATFGEPGSPENLERFRCACWLSIDQHATWNLNGEKYLIQPRLQTNEYAQLRYLAIQGRFIAELPPFLAKPEIDAGRLVRVLKDYALPDQQVHLLYPSRQNLSRVTRSYIDFCLANAAAFLHCG